MLLFLQKVEVWGEELNKPRSTGETRAKPDDVQKPKTAEISSSMHSIAAKLRLNATSFKVIVHLRGLTRQVGLRMLDGWLRCGPLWNGSAWLQVETQSL